METKLRFSLKGRSENLIYNISVKWHHTTLDVTYRVIMNVKWKNSMVFESSVKYKIWLTVTGPKEMVWYIIQLTSNASPRPAIWGLNFPFTIRCGMWVGDLAFPIDISALDPPYPGFIKIQEDIGAVTEIFSCWEVFLLHFTILQNLRFCWNPLSFSMLMEENYYFSWELCLCLQFAGFWVGQQRATNTFSLHLCFEAGIGIDCRCAVQKLFSMTMAPEGPWAVYRRQRSICLKEYWGVSLAASLATFKWAHFNWGP